MSARYRNDMKPRAHSQSQSQSPRNSYNQALPGSNGSSKVPPTGPRAHKKARISADAPPPQNAKNPRAQSPRPTRQKPPHVKMDVDGDAAAHSPTGRDRARDRTRERERERDKDRDRDRDRSSRRSGGRAGGRRADRGAANHHAHGSGDRTLAERLGL